MMIFVKMKCIADIKNVYYINLKERVDRREHVRAQLKSIGIIDPQRFEAIRTKNGRIGCSLSHLGIIKMAKQRGWDHVIIVEDDILFLDPSLFKKQFELFLSNHAQEADMVLLAGNNLPPYQKIDDSCVRVSFCQTTTGYLVFGHYFDTLIHNFKEGIEKLMREPDQHLIYAIDQYWIPLQRIHRWYLIIPLSVIQKPDYSDIEQKDTNYSHLLLDLDKPYFFQARP